MVTIINAIDVISDVVLNIYGSWKHVKYFVLVHLFMDDANFLVQFEFT